MMRRRIIAVGVVALACSVEHLDVGSDAPAAGASGVGGAAAGTGGASSSGGTASGSGGTASGSGGTGGSSRWVAAGPGTDGGGTGGSGTGGGEAVTGGSAGAAATTGGSSTGGTGGVGGGSDGGVPSEVHPSEPLPELPAQTGCPTDSELAALVGTWSGELEDFYLSSIEALTIVINGASKAHGICGTVTWGDGAPLAPASDPDAAYPPDQAPRVSETVDYLPPIERFRYTIIQGGERLPTVRLGILASEPWDSWCRLQTPVWVDAGWTCLDTLSVSIGWTPSTNVCTLTDANQETAVYSLFKCAACQGFSPVCVCNGESCAAQQDPDLVRQEAFDLALSSDGTLLSGSVKIDIDQPPWDGWNGDTIRLVRQLPP